MEEIIGIIAVILAAIGVIPYFLDILKGKTKPHLFSWILWTATTLLVFLDRSKKAGVREHGIRELWGYYRFL